MDETRLSKSDRAEMERMERSYHLWRAGVLTVVFVLLVAGAWAIANAGDMRDYWLVSAGIAVLIVLGFLTQGFGWINYGILSALIFLAGAALVAMSIQYSALQSAKGSSEACCARPCCPAGSAADMDSAR